MILTDRIRVWAWLDVWQPAYSAWRNWRAWRRLGTGDRKAAMGLLAVWHGEMSRGMQPGRDIALHAQSILNADTKYTADMSSDYTQSPRTIAIQLSEFWSVAKCDCEDYATLGGWLFGRVGVHGQIVTMIKRGPRSWRTLWFEPWEAHAVWYATGHAYMVDNESVISGSSETMNQILSWIGRGFEPVHWLPTK
jgi:hypothetical protein